MLIAQKVQLFFLSIKPKVYKKKLFIGKRKILTLTYNGIFKFISKLVWIILVIMILFSMIFGGLAMFLPNSTSSYTNQIISGTSK